MWGDWQYSLILRFDQSIPMITTRDGVNAVLRHDCVRPGQLDEFVQAIDAGGTYEPLRGHVLRIHRRMPTVEEQLRDTALTIRHCGRYGICWWNGTTGVVWWVKAMEDENARRTSHEGLSSNDEIRRRFFSIRNVKQVRIEIEAQPDPRRNPMWVEVYPGHW